MGKVSIGKARIIGFVKGDQTGCFQAMSDLLLLCKNEIEIKREIKNLMRDLGIGTKFKLNEYTAGKRVAKTEDI